MYIVLDRPTNDEFNYVYDHINDLDDKIVSDLSSSESYVPNGPEHIVDATYTISDEPERWASLRLAAQGVRFYSNHVDKTHWVFESPIFAGPIPEADKVRRISVDGAFAESRAGLFAEYGVNYVGRTRLNPRNIFVLDNKKGNPLHDPDKDPLLEALYASLPDDWWGSCGFVSTGNINKLEAFFTAFPDVIPLAWTTGAFSKLKYLGLDYVTAGEPKNTPEYGIEVRNSSNRLSYELSLPEKPEIEDSGFKYNI